MALTTKPHLELDDSDEALGQLADAARAAADRAGAAIDRSLAFVDASNRRIEAMEAEHAARAGAGSIRPV